MLVFVCYNQMLKQEYEYKEKLQNREPQTLFALSHPANASD